MKLLFERINGNCSVSIYDNGTRIIRSEDDKMELDSPLNVDIRVSEYCPYGLDPLTKKSKCSFCHESATTTGKECDYDLLYEKISVLPHGTELAIGVNAYTPGFRKFIEKLKGKYIPSVTVNSYLLGDEYVADQIVDMLENSFIYGLGISYRKDTPIDPRWTLYKNVVIHTIIGIDDVEDVLALSKLNFKKVLLLGEKDVGFNKGKVNLNSDSHLKWIKNLESLKRSFNVLSFDVLGTKQMRIKEHLTDEEWETMYQEEHSVYINAVKGLFHPSSTNQKSKMSWNEMDINSYYRNKESNNG